MRATARIPEAGCWSGIGPACASWWPCGSTPGCGGGWIRPTSAKAGLLVLPPAPDEATRLLAIARAAVERAGPDNSAVDWLLLTLGLAEYRAGDTEAALKSLDPCLERGPDRIVSVPALAIKAVALKRRGRSEAAQDCLARAERLIAEPSAPQAPGGWPDRLIARRLAGEAQAVVRLDPIFPTDPFAH